MIQALYNMQECSFLEAVESEHFQRGFMNNFKRLNLTAIMCCIVVSALSSSDYRNQSILIYAWAKPKITPARQENLIRDRPSHL